MKTLVIGIGNPLAGDDGAGQAVAECLGDMPGVTVRIRHQLTPELAEDVAAADRVVFIDAARGDAARGGGLIVSRVSPDGRPHPPGPLTHVITAETVVALAHGLYGNVPPAYLVRVPGVNFQTGSELSASVHRLIPRAVAAVKRLLQPEPPTP